MASFTSSGAVSQPRRSFRTVLRTYFYWTYPRGSFHYDIMVTLILLFIFVTPHFWNYGDKPTPMNVLTHPIEVNGYGTHGLLITVAAADVKIAPGASDREVKDALRKAVEPVTGDAVFVERWKTVTDAQGNVEWQVWAHR